jgi:Tfp pilus assembly protein PilX
MMNSRRHHAPQRGAALIEIMISTTIMLLTGGIVFVILNTGMILFAKNTAINMAHQQARVAVLQMEQDLHSTVSIPQLVDASKNAVSGNGPAAGISCQLYAKGPLKVSSTANAGQATIVINTGGYSPTVGQRLVIATHQIELKITGVSGSGTTRTLTLESNLPVDVKTQLYDSATNSNVNVNVVCFITDRIYYVVNGGGELRYYSPTQPPEGRLMANDITSASPFSIPVTPAGAQYNRFVAAINLSTADHTSSNRGFKAANMFLNAMVPYRARLCITQ